MAEIIDAADLTPSEPPTSPVESTAPVQAAEPPSPKPETETMEVHHHTHAGHGKKTWKEYGWEFLMLFLAVFCGFLAEYKLEHVIEKQREKKYMLLMLDDLQKDTAEFYYNSNRINSFFTPAHNKSMDLLFSEKFDDSTIHQMYTSVPFSTFSFQVSFHDGTATQLKNSGNLRLIEDTELSAELTNYWNLCNDLSSLNTGYDKTRNDAKDLFFSLFNLHYYENNYAFLPLRKDQKLKLLSAAPHQFIILGNKISNLQSQMEGPIMKNLDSANNMAGKIIKMIEDEYGIREK